MMRSLFTAVSLIVILHVLLAAGFVAWLDYSGRLNRERIDKVVELFMPTIEEARAAKAEAAEAAAEAEAAASRALRMEAVADGPKPLQQRLADEREAEELALHRYQRMLQERDNLQAQLERMRQQVTREQEKLAQQRAEFEAMVDRQKELREDEDFRQAVELLERVKPDQAKQMLQNLLARGEVEIVVEYLAAMQQRIAAKVLGAFEGPGEIEQATELVERLRVRGIEPMPEDSPLSGGATSS